MLKKKNKLIYAILIFLLLFSTRIFAQEIYDFTEENEDADVDKDADEDKKPDEIYRFETDEVLIEEDSITEEQIISPGLKTVFDREEIETSGAKTIVDIIERAPGVKIIRQGGVLQPQMVSIRGGESRHVLVLVDGRASDNLWNGTSDLSTIPISNIERIEVMSGALAAIYGEGAVSGVVNIVTKKDKPPDFAAALEYGYASFNTHKVDAQVSGRLGSDSNWSGKLSGGGLYTGGEYEYKLAENEVKRLNNSGWSSYLSGGLDFTKEDSFPISDFSLAGAFAMSQKGSPGLMEFLTPEAETEDIKATAGAMLSFAEAAPGVFSLGLDYSYQQSRYTDESDETDENNENFYFSTEADLKKDLSFENLFFNLSAATGYSLGHLSSTVLTDSTGAAVEGNAIEHSAYLNAAGNIMYGHFDFIPALRFDLFIDNYASMEIKPELAFNWSVSAGWAPFRTETRDGPLYFRLNGGSAYKNPSFQDLFWPQGAIAAGNPDLLPEKALSGDLGIVYQNNEIKGFSVKLDVSGHISKVEELIQWMPSAGGIWRPSNVGLVLNGGIDSSINLNFDIIKDILLFEITGVYNWLLSKNADAISVNYKNQLAYRPEHSGSFVSQICFKKRLWLNFSGIYTGYRFTNNANTKYLDQVFIFSAATGFDITDAFTVSASAENLFNKYYYDNLGYPVPGFEFGVKGRFQF